MKYIILHDIRSAYNVGAIFRTADGSGVEKVFLSGYTPTPTDRFGRTQAEIEKTSLGASATMAWESVSSLPQLIADLKQQGVTVVAVEQSDKSVSLVSFREPAHVAYIMGNETEGIPPEILAMVDVVVDIPMLGQKESLNVSVAAGVVLYHGVKQ
ncbi:MAG TPA: TrmH family RNA methyltransferase [Candidatus Paceibacterota bacterium]